MKQKNSKIESKDIDIDQMIKDGEENHNKLIEQAAK